MIEVLGCLEGREYNAAIKLKEKFLDTWPDLRESERDKVTLFVGYRMHESRVKDIDILIIGNFNEPKIIDHLSGNIEVKNFLIILEEKSHDSRQVSFEGGCVYVIYNEKRSSATHQSDAQLHGFKKYLKRKNLGALYVSNFILFSQLKKRDLQLARISHHGE